MKVFYVFPCPHLVLIIFLILLILVHLQWYLVVAWICISLMTDENKDISFVSGSCECTFCFKKILFKLIGHFLKTQDLLFLGVLIILIYELFGSLMFWRFFFSYGAFFVFKYNYENTMFMSSKLSVLSFMVSSICEISI
jgi:hypothetical protein